MRLLLRDYVLILANTGIREGTEAENLLWQHVHVFKENGKEFLELSVNGKTGRRDIICRANTLGFLKRIHERCEDIKKMSFEELLKAKLNKPVFRLSDGTVTKNLRQTFKAFLEAKGLLVCPRTGQHRTLYSLRHTYATFALVTDGMEIHTLAESMGAFMGKRTFLVGAFLLLTAAGNPQPTPEQVLADAARYTVKVQVQNEIAFNQDGGGAGAGTGFLIDRERGWLLTNAHVATRSPSIVKVTFKDGRPIEAKRIHVDPLIDLAILAIPPKSIPETAQQAPLACEGLPQSGASVFAYTVQHGPLRHCIRKLLSSRAIVGP